MGTRQKAAIPERRRLRIKYERNIQEYDAAGRRLLLRFQALIEERGIAASVRYRVKSFESYFGKVLRLRSDHASRTPLTDMLGFRIICPFLADLEEVEQALRAHFRVLEVEPKGAKHSFREFGYDSTHILVDVADEVPPPAIPHTKRVAEIQLRTILQDAWAEVEHEVIYKSDYSLFSDPIKRKLASLNAILTLSDVIFQEIRDYQKEMQQWDMRRKTSLDDKMRTPEPTPTIDPAEQPQLQGHSYEQTLPMQHGKKVDRLVLEALAAHGNDEYVKAIQIYSSVLRMKITKQVRSIIYNHRGMAYFALSQYRQSFDDFSRAIRHSSENFRAHNNRALICRTRHQYEQALSDLNQSLEINAIQPEGHYIRALTHFDLEDYAKALEDCERVLNIKPDFIAVQHLKVVIASKVGK